jgi:hypothetical protein
MADVVEGEDVDALVGDESLDNEKLDELMREETENKSTSFSISFCPIFSCRTNRRRSGGGWKPYRRRSGGGR